MGIRSGKEGQSLCCAGGRVAKLRQPRLSKWPPCYLSLNPALGVSTRLGIAGSGLAPMLEGAVCLNRRALRVPIPPPQERGLSLKKFKELYLFLEGAVAGPLFEK